MSEIDSKPHVDEIIVALETAGEIEGWLEQRIDRSLAPESYEQAFRDATHRLLSEDPPRTGDWDHLLSATATRSAARDARHERVAVRAAIERLIEMLDAGALQDATPEQVVTMASALVLALTAQRNLRQPVEISIHRLVERYPDTLNEMAEHCQGIWQKRGQMSGSDGLFVWDIRRDEWRLHQDFRPFRP